MFGSLDVVGTRSLSRDQFLKGVRLPDWCSLFGTDDHDESRSTPVKWYLSTDYIRVLLADIFFVVNIGCALYIGNDASYLMLYMVARVQSSINYSPISFRFVCTSWDIVLTVAFCWAITIWFRLRACLQLIHISGVKIHGLSAYLLILALSLLLPATPEAACSIIV
jgi:hypothetical protein